MSNFGNAFREARNSGQTTFTYNGKLYSTQMSGESKDQWAKNMETVRRPAIQYQDAVLNTIANNWASQMANNRANVVQSNNSPVMVGGNLPDVRGFGAQVPYGRPAIPSGYDFSNQSVRDDVNRYFYAPPDTNSQMVAPVEPTVTQQNTRQTLGNVPNGGVVTLGSGRGYLTPYNGGDIENYYYQPSGRDSANYANNAGVRYREIGGRPFIQTYLP